MVSRLGYVFDLDDTLYPERDFVRSGFQAVARHAAALLGLEDRHATTFFDLLWAAFERDGSGRTFDALLAADPALAARVAVPDLVDVYRSHAPRLSLDSELAALLSTLAAGGHALALLSDGSETTQANKLEALGLAGRFAPQVVTGAFGRAFWKPHPRGYEAVERALGLPPASLVYIGDNVVKDFVTARRRGWRTVRLRTLWQVRAHLEPASAAHAADVTVDSYAALSQCLANLGSAHASEYFAAASE